MLDEYSAILSSPYGKPRETISSARYQWDSMNRGKDPFVIFQYTLEGCGGFEWQGRSHDVPPGSAFISVVPEQARYFYPPESREAWTFCWLNFYGDLGLKLWVTLRERFGPVIQIPLGSALEAQLVGLAEKAFRRKFTDRYEAAAEIYSLYMNCWREAAQPKRARIDSVEEAVRICKSQFRDPISVKELAARCHLSREHLSRVFRERQGVSPAEFLRGQRLEAAAQILRHSSLPVKEVALRSGFYSARHLMKAFTRSHGRTPQQYRLSESKRR